jgi:cyclase
MTNKKQQEPTVHLMDRYQIVVGTGAKHTRYKEIPRYAEGLYDLHHQVYAWMVPNGSWGEANAGLIVGEGQSLLVETLWDVKYTRRMLEAVRSVIGDQSINYVVNTHADGDHFWGNQLVSEAEIITSQASYNELLEIQPRSMLFLGRIGKVLSAVRLFGGSQAGHWFQNLVAPYDFAEVVPTPPTRTFVGELTLDVGGRAVQLIEVGPAHTRGDLMVFVPDSKILFSADIVFIDSTPVMWAGPLDNMLSALDCILEMDVELIVPGHGPLTDKSGVQLVKDYWVYLNGQVEQRYSAKQDATDAAYEIVLSDDFQEQPFAGWNSPERNMVNVHTLYRHLAGRTDHPRVPEFLSIMRQQALLAHQLPDAEPAMMRKR